MRRHSPQVLATALVVALCAGALLFQYARIRSAPRVTKLRTASALPLTDFVSAARQAAKSHFRDPKETLVLVAGNEAGDLDSAASAIALCYIIEHELDHFVRYGLPRARYVPVIQTPRRALSHRRENLAVLEAVGLDIDEILCIDEVRAMASEEQLAPSHNTYIGLVDHAALAPSWGHAHVLIVIDHHADVGAHKDAPLRLIYPPTSHPVGSASSIIAKLYAEALAARQGVPDRAVADLLLSAGVIDTRNYLLSPAGKATHIDDEARRFLQPYSSFSSKTPAKNMLARGKAVFAAVHPPDLVPLETIPDDPDVALMDDWSAFMQSVKRDVGHLDAHQLLARDYKEGVVKAHKFGIASVPIGIYSVVTGSYRGVRSGSLDEDWDAWWRVATNWMRERHTDTLLVMLSYRKEGKKKQRRELIIVSRDCDHFAHLSHGLETAGAPGSDSDHPALAAPLALEEWHFEGTTVHGLDGSKIRAVPGFCAAVWRQKNTKANRKVVQPVLEKLLE
ncbi:exopolyphosphatase [Malassezia cuniculi]|uniref:Exopolyphosphatase n=1 Tax=Malassezia cuniculi TaxID=948313 RepID=A0AAF0EUC2_9BASI|nr:exopolyphosphatase [Malassezia cuniculi]